MIAAYNFIQFTIILICFSSSTFRLFYFDHVKSLDQCEIFNKSLEDAISPYEHKKVNGGNAKYGSEQKNIENLKM